MTPSKTWEKFRISHESSSDSQTHFVYKEQLAILEAGNIYNQFNFFLRM